MPGDASVRVVLVTGGASGIGYAIASRFSAAGDSVAIADIDTERGQRAARTLPNTAFVETDVTDEIQIRRLIDSAIARFGGLDVLCSNAGIERYCKASDYTTADWTAIIDTNLRPAFLLTRYAYPHLRERKGCIVITSSVQAIANERDISVYASSKAGLLGWVRGAAVDFAAEGVRVNAVCPGATQTGMMQAALANEADPTGVLHSLEAKIPLGRIGTPEDVAHAVFFLASAQASYITGTNLIVDGGVLARLAL